MWGMSRRRVSLVAALVFLVVAVSAPPAAGDGLDPQSSAQCGSGQFCVWSSAAYGGLFKGTASTSAVNLSFATVRSVWNRSSKAARVYAGANGTGGWTCFAPGAQLASTTVPGQSVRLLATSTC